MVGKGADSLLIKDAAALKELEDRFIAGDNLSYPKALALVEAMWAEGKALGVLPRRDTAEGLETAMRIARVLNSCSRNSSPA